MLVLFIVVLLLFLVIVFGRLILHHLRILCVSSNLRFFDLIYLVDRICIMALAHVLRLAHGGLPLTLRINAHLRARPHFDDLTEGRLLFFYRFL